MNPLRLLTWFIFILVLPLAPNAEAKCPAATVTVRGSIENLPVGLTGLEAKATLEIGKAAISKSTPVVNNEFSLNLQFSTRSSSSILGDRCDRVPSFVEIRLIASGKVYVERRLKFKDNFETTKSYEYRLKQELQLKFPKEATMVILPASGERSHMTQTAIFSPSPTFPVRRSTAGTLRTGKPGKPG
jgi:hypothetical protein